MLQHAPRLMPVGVLLVSTSCSAFQQALAPAEPYPSAMPAPGQVPDSALRRAISKAELIVLATPLELASQHGFLTPQFQFGAKETWYDVKLAVDSVLKGKLQRAKRPDLGALPAALTPPVSFRLAKNEIIAQYPAVTSRSSSWAAAAPLTPGERAIYIFRRCYYCLQISGLVTGRGAYYTASPLVAIGPESKLHPKEWSRVAKLQRER